MPPEVSDGPVIVAMRERFDVAQIGDQVARAVEVVGGDVADAPLVSERHSARDHRHPGVDQGREEALATAVRRHEQRAVDVPAHDELGRAPLLVVGARHEQHERQVASGERVGGAAHERREVRVLEEAVLRLGEQEGDRVRSRRREVARVRVDAVAGLLDGSLDGFARGGADPVPAVQHPGDRAAGDAGLAGDVFDRRPPARCVLSHVASV